MSATLANERWKRFAVLLAEGTLVLANAYEAAGYQWSHSHASKPAARRETRDRVEDLKRAKRD